MLISFITATDFLFGESTNVMETGESTERGEKFAECFGYATEVVGNRNRLGLLAGILPDKRFNDSLIFVHEYIQYYVQRTLEQQRTSPEKVNDAASKYVFLEQLAGTGHSPKKIQDELINILLAGRDTTASLLSYLWYTLARRPDVFEKLKAEVQFLDGHVPSWEQLKDMKYLHYCLNEILRLYPMYGFSFSANPITCLLSNSYTREQILTQWKLLTPRSSVPQNARMAINDTVLPLGGGPDGKSPIFIKAGTQVNYHVYAMHRREDLYGKDADEFKPERWETMRQG
jgi:hypothetical protein